MQTSSPQKMWTWIPSLFFLEGIPYVVVTTISVMLLKRLGEDNTHIAFFTSLLYLPWVIKPLWQAPIQRIHTRWRICATQIIISATLAIMAYAVTTPKSMPLLLTSLWIVAFASAFHDEASDNLYSQALTSEQQSLFAGTRSKLYYIAIIVGQGITLMFAGGLETYFREIRHAWYLTISIIALCVFGGALYHIFVLPRNIPALSTKNNFALPLEKKAVILAALFILLFIIPKALTAKINLLFFIDPISKGGLGLSLSQIGFAQGTIGIIGLSVGSIIGNTLIGTDGLRKWLWPCAMGIALPQLLYLYICWMHISHFGLICSFIFIEQFGYGFGLAAYMYFMLHFSQGAHERYHYTLCIAVMALGMMLPGLISGWLQTSLGYQTFYLIATGSGFITVLVSAVLFKNKNN